MRIAISNFLKQAIAPVLSFFSNIRFKQAIAVVFASFFVLTSTACSSGTMATSDRATTGYRENANTSASAALGDKSYRENAGPRRELYKPTQKKVGGMNNYNDDPRYDKSSTNAAADSLIKRVENNLQKGVNNPKDIVENVQNRNPLDDKARATARNAKEGFQGLTSDFAESTREGSQNLKENLSTAARNVPNVVGQAADTARKADIGEKQSAQDVSRGRDMADRAANALQNRAGKAS